MVGDIFDPFISFFTPLILCELRFDNRRIEKVIHYRLECVSQLEVIGHQQSVRRLERPVASVLEISIRSLNCLNNFLS